MSRETTTVAHDYWVTVCNQCKTASCWHGEFMCDGSDNAGTVDMLASELRKLSNEVREVSTRWDST